MECDVTSTRCPHCGVKDDGMSQEYYCRKREIPCMNGNSILAIEIYCANCHTTLSITPFPDAFRVELPNY